MNIHLSQFRLFLIAALFAAQAGAVGSARAQGSVKTVRVANGTTIGLLSIPDVRAFDYFLPGKYGIKSEVQFVPGAVRAIQSVLTGAADVGIATLAAGLEAADKGQDIQCFTLAAGARPYLFMTGGAAIQDLRDLQGKTVGIVSLVDSAYYIPAMQMAMHGLDPSSVSWVPVGGDAGRVSALISGSVQAVALQAEQALQIMSKTGSKFHIFANPGSDLDKLIFKCFWAKKTWLRDHADVAERIVAAQLLATREALDKDKFLDLAVSLLESQKREDLSTAYDLIKAQGVWDPDGELLSASSGDFTSQQMFQYHIIQHATPFDGWATTEYVGRALKIVGPSK